MHKYMYVYTIFMLYVYYMQYNIYCILYSIYYTLCVMYYVVYNIFNIKYIVYSILYSIFYILYSIYIYCKYTMYIIWTKCYIYMGISVDITGRVYIRMYLLTRVDCNSTVWLVLTARFSVGKLLLHHYKSTLAHISDRCSSVIELYLSEMRARNIKKTND